MTVTDIRPTILVMGRWQPDSRARLRDAAMELFTRDGYAGTTAAEVAARAGLTERTFFRHFPDKREVLFSHESELRERLADAVHAAPATSPVRDAVMAGWTAVATELQPRHDELRRREEIVASHPELRERELLKIAAWTAELERALRARGVTDAVAALAAGVSTATFAVAARRWIAEAEETSLVDLVQATFRELPTVV